MKNIYFKVLKANKENKVFTEKNRVLSLILKEIIQIENTKIQKYTNQNSTAGRQHGKKISLLAKTFKFEYH